MKKLINELLKKAGYQIRPLEYLEVDMRRRIKIVKNLQINVLLDVGANTGQYGIKMKEFGYANKMISFEPLRKTFETLKANAAGSSNWTVNNYALGSEDTKSMINVSANTDSSSLLNMLPEHEHSAPQAKFVSQEEIEIKKLDSIFDSFCKAGDNVMLKLDTQGYEESILKGAEKSISKIKMMQLEMSLVPLYQNEMLYTDMIQYMKSRGFALYSLENGFSDEKTGKLLQVDGIFVNSNLYKENF